MIDMFKHFASVTLADKLPHTTLQDSRIKTAIQTFLSIAAAIALLIIVIAAFKMVISRGNANDVKKSRETIIYATVGLVISMTAFAIVTFVVGKL